MSGSNLAPASTSRAKAKPLGLHENLRREEVIAPPSEKSFGITFAVVFLLLALWFWLRKDLMLWGALFLLVSVGFLAAVYLLPRVLRPLNLIWLKFGLLLHKVVNPLVMGLLFFAVFTPMGLIMRLGGKDFLRLKLRTGDKSYWLPRSQADDKASSMRNQF